MIDFHFTPLNSKFLYLTIYWLYFLLLILLIHNHSRLYVIHWTYIWRKHSWDISFFFCITDILFDVIRLLCMRCNFMTSSKCFWLFLYHFVVGQYRQISNISRTKSPNLSVSRLVLLLSLLSPLKPGVKSTMKVHLEQRRQAMSDQKHITYEASIYIKCLRSCPWLMFFLIKTNG